MPISAASLDDVIGVLASSSWGQPRTIHFCNTYTMSLVAGDAQLRTALDSSLMNLPDGWPIALVGRALRVRGHAGQIPGPDAFELALSDPSVAGKRHLLYGGTPEVIEKMRVVIATEHPDANIVGAVAPPFGGLAAVLDEQTIADAVNAKPDIVWVGLGTPLQDHFLAAARTQVPATLVAVGAAFDFIAGTQPRAPRALRRMRMEWLYRLAREPRRLWRRYLIGSVRFVYACVRWRPSRVPEELGRP